MSSSYISWRTNKLDRIRILTQEKTELERLQPQGKRLKTVVTELNGLTNHCNSKLAILLFTTSEPFRDQSTYQQQYRRQFFWYFVDIDEMYIERTNDAKPETRHFFNRMLDLRGVFGTAKDWEKASEEERELLFQQTVTELRTLINTVIDEYNVSSYNKLRICLQQHLSQISRPA